MIQDLLGGLGTSLFSPGGSMEDGAVASNNPLLAAGQANVYGGLGVHSHVITGYPTYSSNPFPPNSMKTVGSFRVQEIANGYLVDLVRYEGGQVETFHVQDYKEAGELIIATLVKWELKGT